MRPATNLLTWWDGLTDWQRVVDGSLKENSHTHQDVTVGRKYHYIVAGVDSNGVRGPWSAQVEVTVTWVRCADVYADIYAYAFVGINADAHCNGDAHVNAERSRAVCGRR